MQILLLTGVNGREHNLVSKLRPSIFSLTFHHLCQFPQAHSFPSRSRSKPFLSKSLSKLHSYRYHPSFNFFLATIGFVTKIATANPVTVNTNCALLNPSLSTSNVPEGATRVRNMSNPTARTSEVDSRRAGAVVNFWTFATCKRCQQFCWILGEG